MAKLQNKLFAKLKVVEEKAFNILEDLKLCQQHLAVTVTQCKGLLQDSVKDPDQFLFGLGRMLDDVGNVLFLTIARVGARAPGPQPETEPGDVEHQEEDDIVTMEMKNKLREVLRLAQTLQSFCRPFYSCRVEPVRSPYQVLSSPIDFPGPIRQRPSPV